MKKNYLLTAMLIFTISLGYSQLTEDFEGTFPSTDWTLTSGSGSIDKSSETADHTSGTGNFARYNCYGISGTTPAYLTTPRLVVSSTDKSFSFWTNYYLFSGSFGNTSSLFVDVSSDGGTTWTSGTTNYINNMQDSGWKQITLDLTSFESTDFTGNNVKVRFKTISDYGSYNIAIDDVSGPSVYVPSCPKIILPSITVISSDSTVMSWTYASTPLSYRYEYGPAGFTPGTGMIGATTNISDTLSGLSQNTAYDVYFDVICSVGDTSQVSGPFSFKTPCVAIASPWTEDVETFSTTTNSTIGNCWSSSPSGTTSQYRWNIDGSGSTPSSLTGPTNGAHSGSNYFYVEASSGIKGDVAELVTTNVDLSGLSIPMLEFYTHMYGSDIDTLRVELFDGTTWNEIFKIGGQQQINGTDPWAINRVDLSAFSGIVTVKFKATKGTSYEGDISIDDISIKETPNCPDPNSASIQAFNISSNSANMTWIEAGMASSWQYEIGINGFTKGSGTLAVVSNDTINLTGLSTFTTYDFYVRSICSSTDSSPWAGPYSFTTLCNDTNLGPWIDDVEGHAATTVASSISNCWSATSSASFQWAISNSGTTPSTGTGPFSAHSGNNFFFTEASSGKLNDMTTLVSPSIDLSSLTTPFVEFYYHMYGSNTGSLSVEVFDGTTWTNHLTISGAQQATQASDWIQQYIDISSYTGVIKLRFIAVSAGTFAGDISIDDISVIESPTCFKPSNLMADELYFDSVVLGWNQNFGTPSKWLIEYDTAGFALGTGNIDSSLVDSIGIGGLVQKTSYDVYLRAFCGAGDTSDRVGPITFKTPPSCVSPIKLNFLDLTDTSATVYWDGPAGATDWQIEYGAAGFTQGTGSLKLVTNDTSLITGLMATTGYDVYVRAICSVGDSSDWTGPLSFTTKCSPDVPTYSQDFSTYTPMCWEEAKGRLGTSTVLTGSTSFWKADGFANVGTSGAASLNIYSTNRIEWLLSTSIDLGNGSVPYQVEYDVALTNYASTTTDLMGVDDTLALVISTDNGKTWSSANILRAYVDGDQPSNAGNREFIDLSAYSGVVKFGFYGLSTKSNTDYDVHIDNFMVTNLCVTSRDTIADTLCTGTYTSVSGKVYTVSGTYMDTLQRVRGCDSIIVTNFVNKGTTSTISPVVCDSFVAPSSLIYYKSGTFTDTIPNSVGCDSVITVNLTVNKSRLTNQNLTVCDKYTRPSGIVATTSGTYNDTLKTSTGCDSVIVTQLLVNYSSSASIIDTVCGSYTSPSGKVWTTSGVRNDTINNTSGCDSVITIDMTIYPTSSITRTEVVCNSYTVPETGNVYTVTGTYYDTTKTAFGCDNVITTNLTVNSVSAGTITVSGGTFTCPTTGVDYKWVDCDNGYSFILGETNQTFTPKRNGNYACWVTSSDGCKDTSDCVSINNVSLEEYALNENDIKVLPNPASDFVTINILKQNSNEEVTINLYDIQGKIVHTRVVSSLNNSFTLDLDGIEEGIYTISFSNNYFSLTKKLSVIK